MLITYPQEIIPLFDVVANEHFVERVLPEDEAGGVFRIENQQSTDVESSPPPPPPSFPPPRVGVSIHHEGKSRGRVQSRFECVVSMTLPPYSGVGLQRTSTRP